MYLQKYKMSMNEVFHCCGQVRKNSEFVYNSHLRLIFLFLIISLIFVLLQVLSSESYQAHQNQCHNSYRSHNDQDPLADVDDDDDDGAKNNGFTPEDIPEITIFRSGNQQGVAEVRKSKSSASTSSSSVTKFQKRPTGVR